MAANTIISMPQVLLDIVVVWSANGSVFWVFSLFSWTFWGEEDNNTTPKRETKHQKKKVAEYVFPENNKIKMG